MRGDDQQQGRVFSYVSAEERVPADHPLRAVRRSVDEVLREMTREFDRVYTKTGRPSIAPERLLRALLLQVFYSIRKRTAADGATGLQPVVPVVRGARHGRGGVEPCGVQQEPRAGVE